MNKIKTIVIVILYILVFAMSTYGGYYKSKYEQSKNELNELNEELLIREENKK